MSRKRHINRWIGGAYLVRDPELRTTQSGRTLCAMRIGVHGAGPGYGDGYFNLVAWDEHAERCARYLTKGSEIDVEARLSFREFKRADDSKGESIDLIVDRVNFAGGGSRNGDSSTAQVERAEEEAARQEHDDVPLPAGAADDDIPF